MSTAEAEIRKKTIQSAMAARGSSLFMADPDARRSCADIYATVA
jgi:hypothetical protein